MITVTAKSTRANQPPKYVPNCVNHEGFMFQLAKKGYGKKTVTAYQTADGDYDECEEFETYKDFYKPFFNQSAIPSSELDGLKAFVEKNTPDGRNLIGTKYEAWIIRWGANEGDLYVEDNDVARNEELVKNKIVYFRVHNCWETGINWFQLFTHLGNYPRDVFAAMKPFLTYHSEQEEEEGNWKGWCTTHNLIDIETALNKIGWKIN
jgi:hypothetical protein